MSFTKVSHKESSAIDEVAYDTHNQIMRVNYKKATQNYDFLNVTESEIQEVETSESVGRTIHNIVKSKSFTKSDF